MKRIICLSLILGLAAFVAPSRADDDTTDSATVRQIEFGLQAADSDTDSARFREYRALPNGWILPSMTFEGEAPFHFNVHAQNVLQTDAHYTAALRPGPLAIKLEYQKIPHLFGNNGRTLETQVAEGVLAISDTVQASHQASLEQARADGTSIDYNFLSNLVAPSLAAANTLDIGLNREQGRIEIGLIKDSPVEVKLSYFHEKRRGSRGAGTAFGFGNVVETPEPIEYRTQDITLSAELTRSWGILRGALDYNRFTNGIAAVSFDNPFRVTDATDGSAYTAPSSRTIGGAAVGVVGLPPGNDAMTGSLGLLFKLPHHTRVSATAALGQWGQDAAFIPWTSNTSIEEATHALPASSLNGKIKTLAFSGGITSRPTTGLGLSARFRHYDLDNQTPRIEFPGYVRFDAVWEEVPRISVPYAYGTDRADLSASYDLGSATLEAGYRYDKFNREYRETKETTQGMLFAGVRVRAKDWAVLRLSGETGSRSFDAYHAVEAEEHSFLEPEDPANLTSLRRYDQANKDMTRLNALVQLTPTGKLGLTLAYQMGSDDFKDSEFGLTKADNSVFSADADYTANERVSLFAFYSREDITTNQRGRQSGASLSESALDDWTSDIDTKVDSFGGGAVFTLVEDKLKLNLQGNYQKVDGNNAIASPIGGAPQNSRESVGGVASIPEFNDTELWRALAEAHLKVNASVTLAFGGWLEQYKLRDALAEGIVNYIPGSFFLAASDADYKGHTLYARAIYTW